MDGAVELPRRHRLQGRGRGIHPYDEGPAVPGGVPQGVDGPQGHVVVVGEDHLDSVPELLQPLGHPGGGLGPVPVGGLVGQFLHLHAPVGNGLDGVLRPEEGVLVPRFPLQHHILKDTVPVAVQGLPARPPGVQHQPSLELAALPGVGAHVVDSVPPLDVLRHWLAVEEHQGDSLRLCLVGDDRRRCPVHQVYAQHVAPPGQEAVHLVHLGALAALTVGDKEGDFLPGFTLRLPDQAL